MATRPTPDLLSSHLSATLDWEPPDVWPAVRMATECAGRVATRLHEVLGIAVEPRRLAGVLERLRDGETLRPGELRLCAFGLTTEIEGGNGSYCIVDDAALVQRLGPQLYDAMQSERRGRRLAYGIATSIVTPAKKPDGEAARHLRIFGAAAVLWARDHGQASATDPTAGALRDGAAFFTTMEATPFADYMATGDPSHMRPLDAFNASAHSWARVDAVLRGLAAVLDAPDGAVRDNVRAYLERLEACDGAVSAGLGMILQRWLHMGGRPEQIALRDAAVRRWGNPLDTRTHIEWRHFAGEDARRMVAQWITRRAIDAFFALAGGPTADAERIAFWRQYADSITDFRFYLGSAGWRQIRRVREEIGNLADDRSVVRRLSHASINAFAMGIGDYMFVEFSETGNALYVYNRDELPRGFKDGSPSVDNLKSQKRAYARVRHTPRRWQENVRGLIQDLTGEKPRPGL